MKFTKASRADTLVRHFFLARSMKFSPYCPLMIPSNRYSCKKKPLSALVSPGAGAKGGIIFQVLSDLLFQFQQQMSVLIAPGRSFL